MRKHLLYGWLAASFACGAERLLRPINPVCPPQEPRTAYGDSVCGKQRLCEHLLPDKPAFSSACRAGRLLRPINRV